MPAPARVSVLVKSTTQLNDDDVNSSPPLHRSKGRIVPRRRGRARVDETDSEEELVREPRSDSESETATSTVESETASEFDSETEEEPQSVPQESSSPSAHPRTTTVPTTENGPNDSTFFPKHESWSDMMMNHSTEDLPTVEFSELNLQDSTVQQQQRSAVPSPPPSDHEQGSKAESSAQYSTRGGKNSRFSRKPGQSAREAYINRLNNDPAYVPTVGQFWSHDDRLLDKDLRSLSTWWRGKWQGRGRGIRGRGNFTNGWSPRGRGAFRNTSNRVGQDVSQVEAAWSHDKFDEVKEAGLNRERGNFPRGGRGFKTRNFSRKETDKVQSLNVSSGVPAGSSQFATDMLQFGDGQRTWFAMKPERVWTKQFDGYLHFDVQLKPLQTQGLGQGVRVKLPKPDSSSSEEHEPMVVRLPLDTSYSSKQSQGPPSDSDIPKSFAVKLPSLKSIGKQKEVVQEDITTISPLHVNAHLPSTSTVTVSRDFSSSRTILELPESPIAEAAASQSTSATQVNGVLLTAKEEPVVPVTSQPPQSSTVPPVPVLSPFQPASPYAAPYVYPGHGVSFPPGIAIAENGVTYDIATGRAVYLQTPPPPPPHLSLQSPVYNPRPMAIPHGHHNGVPFMNPMQLAVSPTGFMPTPPLFALPRQSSRIEIRAPDDPKNSSRESQRTRSAASQDPLSNSKTADTFTPNGQATGSYYPESQPLYTPSAYYYPYTTPEGATSFGYSQYSGVDSNQTYEHYNQDPYSQHTAYY